jgi:alkanesulfonate monooxygenase SsuD/methylene tetrahydromethanopterin reductase-like flavin-dependent oxidoreductase (luciferase family)
VRSGFILPGGNANEQLELALVAEDAGWDGVFVWEGAYGVDAWSLLSAIAARSHRVRLGTVLTPLRWRRPWKVASQVATLDHLSGGRPLLTVGLGALTDDLPRTGEEEDLRILASMIDDGIDLIRALWEGRAEFGGPGVPVPVRGHGSARDRPARPGASADLGRRPLAANEVDAAGAAMRRRRAAVRGGAPVSPDRVREMRAWLAENGARPDLDVLAEGSTAGRRRLGGLADRWTVGGCRLHLVDGEQLGDAPPLEGAD